MKIVSKIHQKSIKNQWKWGPWGRPGTTLRVFGFMLVESDEFWPHFGWIFFTFSLQDGSRCLQDGILGRFGLQVGAQNQPKSIPRAIWNVINFLMDLKIDFWSDLVPSWPPNPSKNEAKLAPKSMQVGVLIWELFCDGFWMDFYWFFAPTWHGRSS